MGRLSIKLSSEIEESISISVLESTCAKIGVAVERLCLLAMRSDGFNNAKVEVIIPRYAGTLPYVIKLCMFDGMGPVLIVQASHASFSFKLPSAVSSAHGEVQSFSGKIVINVVRNGDSLQVALTSG